MSNIIKLDLKKDRRNKYMEKMISQIASNNYNKIFEGEMKKAWKDLRIYGYYELKVVEENNVISLKCLEINKDEV